MNIKTFFQKPWVRLMLVVAHLIAVILLVNQLGPLVSSPIAAVALAPIAIAYAMVIVSLLYHIKDFVIFLKNK